MRKIFLLSLILIFVLNSSISFASPDNFSDESLKRMVVVLNNDFAKSMSNEEVISDFQDIGVHSLRVIDQGSLKSFAIMASEEDIESLRKKPFVKEIYEDLKVEVYLNKHINSVDIIGASDVWQIQVEGINVTGLGQTVCVIDTGIDYTHPDLGGCSRDEFLAGDCSKVLGGYNFVSSTQDPWDDNLHGTHVAGTIAANGAIKGVAPDAKLIAIKALSSTGSGWGTDILSGIIWCTDNAEEYNITVISMSLGGGSFSSYCDSSDAPFSTAINAAVAKNISVVVATGNSGSSSLIGSPACMENSTRVGATTKSDSGASFTSRGAGFPDMLLAPGVMINATYPYDVTGLYYNRISGTSMATPHVSGAIALLNQYNEMKGISQLTPNNITRLFRQTGHLIYDSATQLYFPRIDILSSLDWEFKQEISNCEELQNISDNLNAYYLLDNNIDCSNTSYWNEGQGFIPIGNNDDISNMFNGTLDGRVFKISDLIINNSILKPQGLFSSITENALLKNLIIENVFINVSNEFAGGLVGDSKGDIYNVFISGEITSSGIDKSVGGLIGINFGDVNKSFSDVVVSGSNNVGGLIGESAGNIYNSYSKGSVSGNVSGGLVGLFSNTNIYNSYSYSNVSGYANVGGLVGAINNSSIFNSYSSGVVSGITNKGGLIGADIGGIIFINNSFWDIELSGQSTSAGGVGKTTSEMMNISTFSAWNIGLKEAYSDEVWFINNSYTYPGLFYDFEDITPPYYVNFSHDFSIAGWPIELSIVWDDDYKLHDKGTYFFSTNNSGVWVNHSRPGTEFEFGDFFKSTPEILYKNIILNDTVGINIGFKWYARDDAGNEYVTNTYSVMTKEAIPISTCEELQNMSNNVSEDYYLINNIDCSNTSFWNEGAGFMPLLDFEGLFDGKTFYIENLFINSTEEDTGLFASIASSSIIQDVALININITGISNVGSLVGKNEGLVRRSFSNGSINGLQGVGGLVGNNSGSILNSYTDSNVRGSDNTGGLIGYMMQGVLSNSYSSSRVIDYVGGGLIGGMQGGYVENSFWDIELSGQSTSAGGVGKTTSEMMNISTFSAWSITYVAAHLNEIWFINDSDDYPRLYYEYEDVFPPTYSSPTVSPSPIINRNVSFSITWYDTRDLEPNGQWIFSSNVSGSWVNDSAVNFISTPEKIIKYKLLPSEQNTKIGYKWYASDNQGNWAETEVFTINTLEALFISTCEDLQNIYEDLNAHYILLNDIDCSDTINWNLGKGFKPIGSSFLETPFNGLLDGAGYTIHDIFINSSGEGVGFIGYADLPAEIKNLGMVNAYVNSYSGVYTGILAGLGRISISNSYTTGSVSGNGWNVAGLIGRAWSGTTITNSYSSANVTSTSNYVGGLVGANNGVINNSYSIGFVQGSGSSVGGLTGWGSASNVINSFWDVETSNQTVSVGGTGKNTTEMMNILTFNDTSTEGLDESWDIYLTEEFISGNWFINNTYDYPRLYFELNDTFPPTYSNFSYSDTTAGVLASISIIWDDNRALHPNGDWIFSNNNSGTWINSSLTSFLNTPETITHSLQLNTSEDLVIGFKWYVTDNAGNFRESEIYNLTTTPDIIAPSYTNVYHDNTFVGETANFSVLWDDNVALHLNGQWIFSSNISGSWANDSAVNFSSTPSWANVSKTLPSESGVSIGYKWYATDNKGNPNQTNIYNLITITDEEAPTYSNLNHNQTIINEPVLFSVLWDDNRALHLNGQWIFSSNISGSWANDSAVNFSSTPSWANVSKTLPSESGVSIGYKWYATDDMNNSAETNIYALITTPVPVLGCTDPLATNYDSDATHDDGSCEYPAPAGGGGGGGSSVSTTKKVCNITITPDILMLSEQRTITSMKITNNEDNTYMPVFDYVLTRGYEDARHYFEPIISKSIDPHNSEEFFLKFKADSNTDVKSVFQIRIIDSSGRCEDLSLFVNINTKEGIARRLDFADDNIFNTNNLFLLLGLGVFAFIIYKKPKTYIKRRRW